VGDELDCRHVSKKENQVHFDSLQKTIDEGYELCKVCKPE
jgi:methylphosphotriester-DNA--protein-cysteine methyltransferase